MKNVIIHEPFEPPLTEVDVASVERDLGVSLPSDYRSFLLAHNGGHPEPDGFPIQDFPLSDFGVINGFLGIKDGEYDDLRNYKVVFRDRIPANFLPIARDPGGNLLCLVVNGPRKGKIYFWFHEEEADEGKPPSEDNIYFIANSFNDLLNSLTELPEDPEE